MLPFVFLAYTNQDEGALSLAVAAGIILLFAVIYLALHPSGFKIFSQKIGATDLNKFKNQMVDNTIWFWGKTLPIIGIIIAISIVVTLGILYFILK